MRLVVREEKLGASKYVAQYVIGETSALSSGDEANLIDRINTFAPTESRPFVLGLPTGSSPLLIYKSLVDRHRAGDISFKNVVTFNMVCVFVSMFYWMRADTNAG
jgi:glucosamine-6-phosphate deaminase